MVSNRLLLFVHHRLVEIFGCSNDNPFAGLAVILWRLPPIQARTIYSDYKDTWQNLVHMWKLFKIAELSQVMRQKGDTRLIDMLNNVMTSTLSKEDEKQLKSKFV